MVDSNDEARLDEAMRELERIIQDREMKDALLLVFANKQDIPQGECWLGAMILGTLMADTNDNSTASTASLGQASAEQNRQEPCLESRTKLCHDRRRHIRRTLMAERKRQAASNDKMRHS